MVSDDLQMRAIADQWGFEQAVQHAILAGVDLLVAGNNLADQEDVLARGSAVIEKMVDSGMIDADSLGASLGRIDTLRKRITGEQPWKTENRPTAW